MEDDSQLGVRFTIGALSIDLDVCSPGRVALSASVDDRTTLLSIATVSDLVEARAALGALIDRLSDDRSLSEEE